jgi:hypothetical protein
MADKQVGRGRVFILVTLWLIVASGVSPLHGQAMAHRGWAGNGFAVDTWWKQAAFYEIDPLDFQDSNGDGFGDLEGLTSRLDYLQALGTDVIVLSPFRIQPALRGAAGEAAWEKVYGTDEDFDRLEQEASRRHIRLVVDLMLDGSQSAVQVAAMGRFWLGRGVVGFMLRRDASAVALSSDEIASRVRMLRHLCAGFAGDRVLLGDTVGAKLDLPQSFPAHAAGRTRTPRSDPGASLPQIDFDDMPQQLTQWTAATVRGLLQSEEKSERIRLVRSDGPDVARSLGRLAGGAEGQVQELIAKQLAVFLFTGREWPLLYFGQEIGMTSKAGEAGPAPMQWGGDPGFSTTVPWVAMGPNAETVTVTRQDGDPGSLLNWYRKLGALRHSQAALRAGSLILLESNYPDVVAWVRRGAGGDSHATPVLVVMNLSDRPMVVSMRDSLHRAGLEASSGIRPLAISPAGATPSFTASSLALDAYGTYVGELRQAGLEASSAPARHGRQRAR